MTPSLLSINMFSIFQTLTKYTFSVSVITHDPLEITRKSVRWFANIRAPTPRLFHRSELLHHRSLIGFWWSSDLPKRHLHTHSHNIVFFETSSLTDPSPNLGFSHFLSWSIIFLCVCVCVTATLERNRDKLTFSFVLSMVTLFLIWTEDIQRIKGLLTHANTWTQGTNMHFLQCKVAFRLTQIYLLSLPQSQFLSSFQPLLCFLTVLVPLFDIHKMHYCAVQRSPPSGEATLAGFSREERE